MNLGVEDVIAWSGVADQSVWLLTEGAAGFMEFIPGKRGWRLAKSGHETRPELVLAKVDGRD